MERRHVSTAGIGLMMGTNDADPWAQQPKYAKGIAVAVCIVIILAALLSIPSRLRLLHLERARSGHAAPKPLGGRLAPPHTLTSLCRFMAYRQLQSLRIAFVSLRFPALGATLLMCAFMLGFAIWTFAVQPYYRLNYLYGSPPLALRSGLMALGLMPFIYALAGKVNFISMIVGTSHERLQVYHQWMARFMFFLSTVHVIPFIHQPLADGGTEALREWFYNDHINTTGTVAYACLFVLVFGSFFGLRERCYELFVIIHIPVAIAFLAFMMIHTEGLLNSWRFLEATAALYVFSVFLRIARQISSHSIFCLCRCQVEALEGGVTRLTIRTPLTWKPGQHVFVRFPALAPWSSHPFTIVSMPRRDEGQLDSNLVLLATARGGFTKQLHALAVKNQSGEAKAASHDRAHDNDDGDLSAEEHLLRPGITMTAIVDGPYGQDAGVADFGSVLFLAGGSGITLAMASLLDLAWQWRQGTANTQRAHLVWSVRDEAQLGYIREHLETVEAFVPKGAFSVSIHISGSASEEVDPSMLSTSWEIKRGHRPDVALTVETFISSSSSSRSSTPSKGSDLEKGDGTRVEGDEAEPLSTRSAAVVVCGPESMAKDASNRVARIQLDIARGRLPHLDEVYLLKEHFNW
ncbi:hypothetical protein ACQY0O_001268 [Thecaphora frezii]